MEKNIGSLVLLLGVICLLVGGVIGYAVGDNNVVEVPGETVVETVVETEYVDVPVEDTLLDDSVSLFLEEVEDEDDLLECDGEEYDFDEISLSNVDDDYTVTYDGDDVTVNFNVKLKYKESDLRSCRDRYDVEVYYEMNEDPEVSVV